MSGTAVTAMQKSREVLDERTRRQFLGSTGIGIGGLALAALSRARTSPAADVPISTDTPLAPRRPHRTPTAKRIIYLHLTGSPPNLDIYDYKPELVRRTGQDCPDEFLQGRTFAFTSGVPRLLGTPRRFTQHGESGTWLSDAVPHFHPVADEMCFIHSMYTEQFNHAPAELLIYTGSPRSGRPSSGTRGRRCSWTSWSASTLAPSACVSAAGRPSNTTS